MKNLSINKLKIFCSIIFVILFFSTHYLIQQQNLYNKVFKSLFLNYVPNDINHTKTAVPYQKISNTTLRHWDADGYMIIKDNMYDINIKGDRIFASFPLFPILWKITHLPAWGIMLLNIIFFVISILVLSYLFEDQNMERWKKIFLFSILFTFPGSAVFYIPYSEALFMIMITIAMYGFMKDKYWIYCIGIFLAAMTRSVAIILIATFFAAELLIFLEDKKIKIFIYNFFKKIAPLILGTLAASTIQLAYGSGSIFKFIEVQKYWDYKFQIPKAVSEWSEEGYSNSIATMFFIAAPALLYLIYLFLNKLKTFTNKKTKSNKKEYLFNLSIIYVVAMFLFILLFKGGNLYGTTRYIVNTPFFFVIIYAGITKLKDFSIEIKSFIFGILVFTSLIFTCMVSYSGAWNFSDFGYLMFAVSLAFILFSKSHLIHRILFFIIVFFNILWATYLFNMFLADAWISM
ncbi:MAG: hypothetical protein HXX09_07700 [Bacteroidetes bacterium]|nr:hypothetical protein [Bacteroidota bacterium]